MKYVVLLALVFSCSAYAGDIEYGYNTKGDYVPVAINGKRIEYGYNTKGEFVPISIGNERIEYGYNTMPDGEEIYFIPNPALGLWINKEKF